MKLSIVLSTYNGKAYIIEQLDSILNQTRKADVIRMIYGILIKLKKCQLRLKIMMTFFFWYLDIMPSVKTAGKWLLNKMYGRNRKI